MKYFTSHIRNYTTTSLATFSLAAILWLTLAPAFVAAQPSMGAPPEHAHANQDNPGEHGRERAEENRQNDNPSQDGSNASEHRDDNSQGSQPESDDSDNNTNRSHRSETGEEHSSQADSQPNEASEQAADSGNQDTYSVAWQGNGRDSVNRTCNEGYIHWVLTPGGPASFQDAWLEVDGQRHGDFERKGNSDRGAMHLYTDWMELDRDFSAKVDGEPMNSRLVISDACQGEEAVLDEDETADGGRGGISPEEDAADEVEAAVLADRSEATEDMPDELAATGADTSIATVVISVLAGIAAATITWVYDRRHSVAKA